jgi:hypothetical protein
MFCSGLEDGRRTKELLCFDCAFCEDQKFDCTDEVTEHVHNHLAVIAAQYHKVCNKGGSAKSSKFSAFSAA